MLITPDLHDAIEALYFRFEGYRRPHDTNACPCCHTPEQERVVHSKPLRKLECAQLQQYAQDAILTWGDGDTFRHFLPRLFELIVEDYAGLHLCEPQILFSTLRHSDWRSWPLLEQDAVTNYFRKVWAAALESSPDQDYWGGVDDWIGGIAQAEDDLSPYLDDWLAANSVAAHLNLVQIVMFEGFPLTASLNFWEDRKPQYQQLAEWLRGNEGRQKLLKAIDRWGDAPFAEQLFETARILE